MEQFRSAFTNDVNAQDVASLAMKYQLQPTGGVATNLTAGNFTIISHPYLVRYVFVRQLFFCFADERNLRDGVDAERVVSRARVHRLVICSCNGDAALLHRD